MDGFVGMLIGLLKTRNINLTEIAIGFASDTRLESRYRRIQRFIHGHRINFDSVAWFVMALFGFIDSPYYLPDQLEMGQEKPQHFDVGGGL